MIGNVIIDLTDTSKACDVVVTTTGGSTQTFPAAVTYSDSASSKVSNISPRYGSYKGGETVTLTGSGFSTVMAETSVKIDGIDCVVTMASSTSIQCTTGARPTVVSTPNTVVTFSGTSVNGYASMQGNDFTYANYWTDLETWGGEYAPQAGESIVIPKGQMLIVDIDHTPQLYAIVVQGSLVFIPHSDPNHQRTIDASYIFIDKGGVFECGTETARYTSKLTFTMHGTRQDIQIPTYGNKGIFVRHALFDMHGAYRNTTWTELSTTLAIGGNTITTVGLVDWVVGEKIAIASTDFSLEHAEEFTITAIDNTGTKSIITLDRPAEHKHFAEARNYTGSNGINPDKTKELVMRAEVGLLTRNIVYKGADDDSVVSKYGAHIMLHSPGDNSLTGRISYIELTQVGQAFQLGRYPIHFHMIGTVHGSYIKGNAIHHTYNRACTIHGVHYLTIEDNFAFQIMGHTYFIEDAVETNNNLHRNLAMKTMRSWSLLNTDQTPASFWITHPTNYFVDNHAAGSEQYGFWFDLKTHSTGPSTDPNVCPQFERLGEFTGNVAHSNGKYGLRIFHRFTPVEDPCAGLLSGTHLKKEQPTGAGTAPQITFFRDFTSYKNNRTGLIAEEFGALKFQDIKVADNLFSGVEFGIPNVGPWLTDSDVYQLEDTLIVGASNNAELPLQKNVVGLLKHIAADSNEVYSGTRGLKGARSEKMRVKDTIFADFNEDANWGAIGTCSHCESPATDSSGRTYFFKNTFFINSDKRIKFDIPFKEIIYDQDGSIGNSTHRWIVSYFPHLDVPECARNENMYSGLLCSDTISIRRVVLHHGEPDNALRGLPLKVYNMRSIPLNRRMMAADSCANAISTASFATMKATDDNALSLQTQLLTQFHIKATNKTIYAEQVKLFESTGLPSHNAAAVTAYNNMNAAQIEIDRLQPLAEAEYGKYDELWKYDTNFCNPDHYTVVDFRLKSQPTKNWVFNAITGYEYHTHFAQGADFLTVKAEYSDAELLQGETDGIIIHLNHTERREALNFSYTDSSLGANTISAAQSTYVSLNSSSKMGDVYFNNVTRHIQIKMDGQNNDKLRFELLGDECISWGNCNPDLTEDAVIETNYRRWSDPASWTSGSLPVTGDEVLIEPTWNMLYDLADSPVFKSIEVNGRLTIENDGGDHQIQAQLIFVRKGELIVGNKTNPFTGNANFILHGQRSDRDIYFHDKMFEGGNKVIANTGKLNFYGALVDVKFTRLAAKANVGDTTITLVDTPLSWKAGDQLGIAPSGRDYTQRDAVTIQSISGNVVTLQAPILFEHYGAASHDATVSGGIDIRAEVIHLTRNIKVTGTNQDKWGAHVVTAHNKDSQFLNGQLRTITRRGYAVIDHVEFVNCSQYDTEKAAVRFADISGLNSSDTRSSVTNSAVHDGLGIGILVTSAEDITVEGNVVWFQHIGGIWMKASDNSTFKNNVVAGMGTRYWSGDTKLDEIAAFDLCNKHQKCKDLTVIGNVAAGGERAGFAIPTLCDSGLAEYSNNMAHTFQHGTWLLANELCGTNNQYFGNFQTYKTIDEGIFAYQAFSNLIVKNVETLDTGIGLTIMQSGMQDYNYISIMNTTIWGESAELPKDTSAFCIDLSGMWITTTTEGGKVFPEADLCKLPYHKFKTNANWFTEGYYTDFIFKNWPSKTRQHCASPTSKVQNILFLNPFGSDHAPVDRFINPIFDNVHSDAIIFLADPNPHWAIIKECGNFPCTGPDNAVIKFEGASFIGANQLTGSPTQFQILPNNPNAVDHITGCSIMSQWNGYLCTNPNIAQIMFESLDGDKEDRSLSPINILGIDRTNGKYNSFNNTLNSFFDHCWDEHYTCLKRLSRFPGLVELDKKYEVYFTGTHAANTRYTIEGANADNYLIVKIDYTQSILHSVSVDTNGGPEVDVSPQRYNRTLNKPNPLNISKCGDSRYEQATYIYEFVLRRNCTVYLRAQEHLIGLARLQISVDQFFEDDFVNKLSNALGITTDQIRIVGISAGSTIVNYQITSTKTLASDQRKNLIEMSQMLAAQYQTGTLDLGANILDLVNQIIAADGASVTSGTGDYKKKTIHPIVYALLILSAVAVVVGIIFGTLKMMKVSKIYREIVNEELVDVEEVNKDIGDGLEKKPKVSQLEEVKE